MIRNLRAAVLALGAIASIPAAGAPILISQTFTFDRLISGTSNALSFDLAPMLASAGLSASGIESGSLVVSGFSDPSYGSPTTAYGSYQTVSTSTRTVTADYWVPPYTYSYRCGFFSYCYRTNPGYWRTDYYTVDDRHDERMVDIRHADTVADTLSLHVGDSTVSGVTASSLNVQNAYGQRTYEGNSCSYYDYYGNCSYTYYYSRQRDVYSAIYGAVNASLGLDGTALTALKNSGQLDLNLAMDIGQMTLQSIRFDLLLVDPSDSSTSVPAPGSLMLASSALVGFALASRRRRIADSRFRDGGFERAHRTPIKTMVMNTSRRSTTRQGLIRSLGNGDRFDISKAVNVSADRQRRRIRSIISRPSSPADPPPCLAEPR